MNAAHTVRHMDMPSLPALSTIVLYFAMAAAGATEPDPHAGSNDPPPSATTTGTGDVAPGSTPETTLHALWNAMSHAAGTKPDMATLQRLFHGDAVVFGGRHDGRRPMRRWSADEFLKPLDRIQDNGFFECEIHRVVHAHGRFATAYSIVESRSDPASIAADFVGVNGIQMFLDAGQWKILSLYYYVEDPALPIPSDGTSGVCLGGETDAKARVENGLLPAVVLDGQDMHWSLASRMQRWNVPGVSIAVIDGGRIAWSAAYGVADADTGVPLTVRTRMQAASVSKPVAASAAMTLVANGKLTLDADVNDVLRTWKVPRSHFVDDQPVTLRHLLSHTAGLSVPGYDGYAHGMPVPTLDQILDGTAPANSPAVVSREVPGTSVTYSGGGYQVVQRLLEDATGLPFPTVLRNRVFVPAGMADSHYEVVPGIFHASGHDMAGVRIEGGWRTHPELAAAGLWTTATDLARFSLALTAPYHGDGIGLLPRPVADTMFTPVFGFAGLGPAIEGEGRDLAISHAGQNEGFRSYWIVHPARGRGVVVMSNGEGSFHLIREIVRAVAATYGWDDQRPAMATTHPVAPAVLDLRQGEWIAGDGDRQVSIRATRIGHGLALETREGLRTFIATGDDAMVDPETGETATFETPAGKAQTMTLSGEVFTLH